MATISPPPRYWLAALCGTFCTLPNIQVQQVLDRIDADFDNSLQRLFALLRIKSISADPAFAQDCKAAAAHLANDIASLGFETEVRPTCRAILTASRSVCTARHTATTTST